MMRFLQRWPRVWGLVGGLVLSASIVGDMAAFAFPPDQVRQQLQVVPVFTLTNASGSPLVAKGDNGAEAAPIFISQQDAQAFLDALKRGNPQVASEIRVMPVSLGEVYHLAQQNLPIQVVPDQKQVTLAQALEPSYRQGTPLFAARNGQNGGYLTIDDNGQQIVPFFFEKERLEALVAQAKQQQPSLTNVVIEVATLEGFISTLESSDDADLKKILLVPSQAAIEFIQSQPQPSRPQR